MKPKITYEAVKDDLDADSKLWYVNKYTMTDPGTKFSRVSWEVIYEDLLRDQAAEIEHFLTRFHEYVVV